MATKSESTTRPLIVIYRRQVEQACEDAFRALWREVTNEGCALGSLGSCLTRDESGDFTAIALWPDEATRAAAFARMTSGSTWVGAKRIGETKLYVEDDLWVPSPFAAIPTAIGN
jgi:hypothetical protein